MDVDPFFQDPLSQPSSRLEADPLEAHYVCSSPLHLRELLVGGLEDIRLAWIQFALNTLNEPVTRRTNHLLPFKRGNKQRIIACHTVTIHSHCSVSDERIHFSRRAPSPLDCPDHDRLLSIQSHPCTSGKS